MQLGGLSELESDPPARAEPESEPGEAESVAETEDDLKGRNIAEKAKRNLRAQDANAKNAFSPRGAVFEKIVMTL